MTTSIDSVFFTLYQSNNKLLLRQFQLDQNGKPILIDPQVSDQNMNFLSELLSNVPDAVVNHDIIQPLFRFLDESFAVLQNGANPVNNEKLAIMVTDDRLNFDIDPFTISKEFVQRDIISIGVAYATPADEVWSFYDRLTSKTRGHFMLWKNFLNIFKDVISSVLAHNDTLRDAFLRVRANEIDKMVAISHHINDSNENDQITDNVEDILFKLGFP